MEREHTQKLFQALGLLCGALGLAYLSVVWTGMAVRIVKCLRRHEDATGCFGDIPSGRDGVVFLPLPEVLLYVALYAVATILCFWMVRYCFRKLTFPHETLR